MLMAQNPSSSTQSQTSTFSLSQRPDSSSRGNYVFSKAVLVSQAGGCRVLSYCEPLSCLLASQPSPHASLVPGENLQEPRLNCHKYSDTQTPLFLTVFFPLCLRFWGEKN